MKYLKLFFIICSFTCFGQENNFDIKKTISEIEIYIKSIDLNSKNYVEEYDGKKIKNIELEERSWNAYYLKENIKTNKALRIKYSEFSPKKNIHLNIYYKNGEIIFAEYLEKPKNKKSAILRSYFYFQNSILVFQKKEEHLKFNLSELLNNEKMIKGYFEKTQIK